MTLRLALLGDSIGYGIGAARTDDTLAPRLAADLARYGRPSQTRVFAMPGARSADLAAQVVRAVPWRTDIAVIVIGANDLTRLVPVAQAAGQLRRAVRSLRAAGAQVVVAPAPDLSVLPHVPPVMRELVQTGSRLLRQAQLDATIAEGGRVADVEGTTSAAFARDRSLFSGDRFHPSSAGYAMIADALAPAVRAAADDLGPVDQAG
ncbi:MAG TPA: SGNH/GDSL hydrolase family protein [Cryptosporangiaceae bacterium]|nr:SGNH/GDSL hydrolase family protein [Cryptosporangiaceae bacterium]